MSSSTAGSRCKRRKPPLLSASKIVADTARASHLLKIDGYSSTAKATPNGKCIYSHSFKVGGYTWRIRYYPNGRDKYSSNHVSLYLALEQEVDEPVQVQYDLRFVDEDEDEESPLESSEVTRFKSYDAYGDARFFRRTELETSRHLSDDAFTIQCDMLVIKFVAGEVTPPATVPVPPSNLQQHLRDLLDTEHGADVVFQVGGETLAAHRWMLAIRSPVFNAELFGAMKESSTGVVRVDDMEPVVFRALLYFIYTDLLPEMKHGEEEYIMSQHLLVASDKYNLERLKSICQQKLCKHIEASNVTFILELAEQHQCHALKDACFEFLKTPAHLEAALVTDSFNHMSRNCPSIMMELVAKLGTQAKATYNTGWQAQPFLTAIPANFATMNVLTGASHKSVGAHIISSRR